MAFCLANMIGGGLAYTFGKREDENAGGDGGDGKLKGSGN